jgi:transcriptional regulator with XRE-family HTH domain
MTKISALVKRLRDVHQMSQPEIARRTGLSQSRISRWENDFGTDGGNAALKLAQLVDELDRKAKRAPRLKTA